MAEVVRDKNTGELFVRAGANQLFPITEDQVEVAQETDVETFVRSVGNSIGQLATGAGALAGVPGARERFDEFQQAQQVRNQASPIAATVGSMAPDVAAGVATGGLAGVGSTGLRTAGRQAAVVGATEGALGAARTPDDPLTGALLQGGIGAITAGSVPMAARFVNTAQDVVNGGRRRAAQLDTPEALSAQGYRDPWYAGRGKGAQQIGAAIESYAPINLLTRAGERAELNQAALNRTVMQDIYVRRPDKKGGVQAQVEELGTVSRDDTLTPGFFDAAEERFKQDYAQLADDFTDTNVTKALTNDTQLRQELADVIDTSVTSVVRNSELENILDRTFERVTKGMTPENIVNLRSDLSRYATQQATSASGDRAAAQTVSAVVTAIDNAIERALQKFGKGDVVDEWKDITRRYMVMQSALEGRAVDIASGNVNARTMMNNLSKPRRRGAGQTTTSFDATRHYADNATTGIPDSGTATRQLASQLGGTALLGVGAGTLLN